YSQVQRADDFAVQFDRLPDLQSLGRKVLQFFRERLHLRTLQGVGALELGERRGAAGWRRLGIRVAFVNTADLDAAAELQCRQVAARGVDIVENDRRAAAVGDDVGEHGEFLLGNVLQGVAVIGNDGADRRQQADQRRRQRQQDQLVADGNII